jgi:hypothetical protein
VPNINLMTTRLLDESNTTPGSSPAPRGSNDDPFVPDFNIAASPEVTRFADAQTCHKVTASQPPLEGLGSDKGLRFPPDPQIDPAETHPIAIADLGQVIVQMSANSDLAFSEEFECLELGDEFSRKAAQIPQNKIKNR